jgi:uncharacterized protein involved in exopolysaccharide biosynthesis
MHFSFHRWCAITFVVFAITLYTGKYVTENFIPKGYTATAEVQFKLTVFDVPGQTIKAIENLTPQSEIAVMESPDVLLPVIQDLGLDKTWAKSVSKDRLNETEALNKIAQKLRIDAIAGTNILKINVTSGDPMEAAQIANAIADRYKAKRDSEEDQRVTRGMDSLRQYIAMQQKVVEDQKTVVEKMRQVLSSKHIITSTAVDPAFSDFTKSEHKLADQQSLLDALNVRLKQDIEDVKLMRSSVRIISRAEVPEYPSSPDKLLCFGITVLIAVLVSLVIGCFVEMILLFIRASEGEHS